MKKAFTIIAIMVSSALAITAQNPKTTSKMLYHNGPVLTGIQHVYVIWYGCWQNNCGLMGDTATEVVISDFLSTIGDTPYLAINSTYTDSSGHPASSSLIFGGSVDDSSYSHGVELTDADIQGIIYDQVFNFRLPQDPSGIYVVIASADVASAATGFCTPGAPPYHKSGVILGGLLKYIFLGNPNRCPSVAGPQFFANNTRLPTPHNSYAGDTLASNLAHALDATLTNPFGDGWFDRYGLENADKCQNTFGQTYLAPNGTRANINLGGAAGDYLIQQNWINDRRPRCAMSQ